MRGCSMLVLCVAATAAAQERQVLDDGWEAAVEQEAGVAPESGWRETRVPATFEELFGAEFDGTAWYRCRVVAPERSRVRLVFHGAATAATVRADGREVGEHVGAWSSWAVDVTSALDDGEALVEVRVDELPGHLTQGFLPVIQPHFGGLWRPVELHVDRAPSFAAHEVFAFGDASGDEPVVRIEAPVRPGPRPNDVELHARVAGFTGATSSTHLGDERRSLELTLTAPGLATWSPWNPRLHELVLELREAGTGRVLDRLSRRVGFRDLRADGTTVLWNGRPLQLRGMLHWGYSPPRFAPPDDRAHWRAELESIRALGCNMVKACLWVPPRSFYEVADELGLVVWQEYPTWHADLDESRLPELRREFAELHRHDRSHPSVAIRSLTCETGHSADLAVVRELYDQCKALVPQTLVVDDSAWIEWHRIHDFWDDHPYGNNSWWPGKLEQLDSWIDEHGEKPLLLGECIAADTWLDLVEWDRRGLRGDAWWAPWGLDAQRDFARRIEGRFGAATRHALLPWSLGYALRNRKYQVERLRVAIPDAGYTLSVVRDFTKARMGFFDDFGRSKWSADEWAWHRDTLIALDVEGDRRAFAPGGVVMPIRVSHFGKGALRGELAIAVDAFGAQRTVRVELEEGELSQPFELALELPDVEEPTPFELHARLSGSHPASNSWSLWLLPPQVGPPPDVQVVEALDADVLGRVEAGANVVVRAGDRPGSPRTVPLWFLKGAPWAPLDAPRDGLPVDLLLELQSFDLETGRVLAWPLDEVDPVLGFWDTHDRRSVESWLLAFTTGVGEGRLAVSALDHDSDAGRHVLERLASGLRDGPPPRRTLHRETVERLRSELSAEGVDLRDWELAVDPDDRGLAEGWHMPGAGVGWRAIRAGRHWEAQGVEHYDGVAWYRTAFDVPERWRGRPVHAVFDGVDDSYRLYVNGAEVARFGDPETGATVWLERTVADLSATLRYGSRNDIALRVVDHAGAGGIHRPARVTTGPVTDREALLHPPERDLARPRQQH